MSTECVFMPSVGTPAKSDLQRERPVVISRGVPHDSGLMIGWGRLRVAVHRSVTAGMALIFVFAANGLPFLQPLAADETAPTSDNADAVQQFRPSSAFYTQNTVQQIALDVSEDNLRKLKEALPKRIYVPATFRWNDVTLENVGVRYKGNSSSNPNQPFKRSFLIKFSEFEKQQRFLGLERIALDNGIQFGSLFSEPLVTEILRDLKIPASRCNHATLQLNGKFHGVYVNVERIDTTFVRDRFPPGKGPLYKCDLGGPGANLQPVPDEAWQQKEHRAFEAKSKAAQKDADDVRDFITRINATPPEQFAAALDGMIHTDAFLKTMAVMLYAGAFDQLTGWNPHNYYLYRDPGDERWHYLPWDLDVGFADHAFGQIPVIEGWNAAWPVAGGPPRPLTERIVDDPKLLERYRQFADEILEQYFHPDVLQPKLNRIYDRLQPHLASDPFPPRRATVPSDRGYDSIVASISEFIRTRYATARQQLDNSGPRPKIERPAPGRGREPEPGESTKGAPSDLRVAVVNSRSVKLQWIDNAKGEAGHIVQRADGKEGAEFRNAIGRPGPNSTDAVDTGVESGQTYRYRVYAVKPTPQGPAGTSVSNVVTVHVPTE